MMFGLIKQDENSDKRQVENFQLNLVCDVMERLCLIEDKTSNKSTSSNFVKIEDPALMFLRTKVQHEMYFLYDKIPSPNQIKEKWGVYRKNLFELLPHIVNLVAKNTENRQDTLIGVLERLSASCTKHKASNEFRNQLLNTICDNYIIGSEDHAVGVSHPFNSPIIWKHLLNAKLFDIFISLMEKYIKDIDLTSMSDDNLVKRRNFDVTYDLLGDEAETKEVETKETETLRDECATHPIYGFFVLTCLWGVTRRDHEQYKKYLKRMVWSVLYPNVKILTQFFQNNDNCITNMQEIYQLFCNIYKNIDDLKHGRFYNDSDIWTDNDDNLDQFEQFVVDTMNKSLCVQSTLADIVQLQLNGVTALTALTQRKPKSKGAKIIRGMQTALANQALGKQQKCRCHCDCNKCGCCDNCLGRCKQFTISGLTLIFCGLTSHFYQYCHCSSSKTDVVNAGQSQLKKSIQKKILVLGIDGVGKSTLFKQMKIIYPSHKAINNKDKENAQEKEKAKSTIRISMINAMSTLVSRGIMHHRDFPETFTEPAYPEAYEIHDLNVEDDYKHTTCVVNIKDAIKMVVDYWKDDPDDETDEHWVKVGNHIHALWKQQWIQDIFHQHRLLFHLPSNMDYFFDKVRDCMAPNYQVNDEDYLKMMLTTTSYDQYEFVNPWIRSNSLNSNSNISKLSQIRLMDFGGRRHFRKRWVHHFDLVSTLIYVCALDHYCHMLSVGDNINGRKNAMWESLDLFHCILDGKWFRNVYTPIAIFLTREGLFRQCILLGYQLKDCFDADYICHPDAVWPGAYNENVCKYTDIEWDTQATFQPTYEKTAKDVEKIHFEHVVQTQIEFISNIFLYIAQENGKMRDKDVYLYTINLLEKDNVKNVFDNVAHKTILRNTIQMSQLL